MSQKAPSGQEVTAYESNEPKEEPSVMTKEAIEEGLSKGPSRHVPELNMGPDIEK